MDEVQSFTDHLQDSWNQLWDAVGGYLPKLLGALVLVVVGLLVAKLAQMLVEWVLKLFRVDRLAKNTQVAKSLETAEIKGDVVSIAGRAAFWVVILVFTLTIADVLELGAMSEVIQDLVNYLPNVLAAVIVLTITLAGARLVRDILRGALSRMRVDFGDQAAALAFYVLAIFGVVMTFDQLGFNTTILTANLTVVVAGVMLALGLAFGLGGRDAAAKIVDGAYNGLHHTSKKR